MSFVEQARQMAEQYNKEQATKKKIREEEQKHEDANMARDQYETLKEEVRHNVLEAGKTGVNTTFVNVFSWHSSTPRWFEYFKPIFEEYLKSEGIHFHWREFEQNAGYELWW